MALGAMGAATLSMQAFLAPSAAPAAPAAPALRGTATSQAQGQNRAAQVAAAAVCCVALGRGRKVARAAEETPFAGGLIGGESAFAGKELQGFWLLFE